MIQSLEQSHFHYARCQGGGMHEGQTLNLVCVDDQCDHRGIICPVCKMESHQSHHILPIKIFLGQIRDLLTSSHSSDDLYNLGAYLRSLQNTKKELQDLLRDQVNKLSAIFKDIELKIDTTYVSLRRNVLIQSTLTTKLPSLLEELMNGAVPDAFNLQREFNKYCQLIKYKDSKPKVTDKASSLVEHFKTLPSKLKSTMEKGFTDYNGKLKEVVNKLQAEEKAEEVDKKDDGSFCFSATNKNSIVKVNEKKDEAWMDSSPQDGYIYLNQAFTKEKSTLTLEILSMNSGKMLLGVGNTTLPLQSESNGEDRDKLDLWVSFDGSNSRNYNNLDDSSSEQDCIFFYGQGNKVSVTVDWDYKVCRFTNLQENQVFSLPFKSQLKEGSQMRLCLMMGGEDRVKLIQA